MSLTLPLQDGMIYNDGHGPVWIAGTCRDHPAWCWSIQGDWYERSTGKVIDYRPVPGTEAEKPRPWHHVVSDRGGLDDIAHDTGKSWRS